ncbi:MAG: hypothetical protein K8R92_02255 [Planctomycetes bacterium]|nr:hypothetical protein [Planctomycetota bacterium]
MAYRLWTSRFNRFALAVIGVMLLLGMYAILANSEWTACILATLVLTFLGLVLGRCFLWLWFQSPWLKLVALSSWLCISFVVSIFVSSIWEWSHWWSPRSDEMERMVLCALIYLLMALDCMWLLRLRLQKLSNRLIRAVAFVLAVAVGVNVILFAFSKETEMYLKNSIPFEWFAISYMIAGASQIASLILATIEKERAVKMAQSYSDRITVQMNCPRCGEAIQLPMGPAHCSKCRLAIQVVCDEPHCECGYLLHKLTGINCPECGKVVPEKLRWDSAVSTAPAD